MKRILLFAFTTLVLSLFSAPGVSAFGLKDVLKMNGDGIADSLIVLKIQGSGKSFHLSADDMHALKEAGVSGEVISAMLRTEARDRGRDYYDYGGYYPYTYPYTHVFLGFGARHYYTPYYWSYRFPRYRPYYANPYPRNYGNYRYRGSYGSRQPGVGGSGTQYRHR